MVDFAIYWQTDYIYIYICPICYFLATSSCFDTRIYILLSLGPSAIVIDRRSFIYLPIIELMLLHLDYLHVTKRFGIVAASQFPMHYLLSMKSLYSPVAFAFRCSHEQLNPYHRILGRIIYSLLILHGGLYINFYIQKDLLWERLSSQVPLLGLSGLSLLTLLVGGSLATVRRWSYRVFFVLHLTIAGSIFPVLFFHASPLRLHGIESLAIFLLDLLARKFDTVTVFTTITPLPSTKLIKLHVEIPPSKIYRFMLSSGQHIYLSIPPQSWPDKITVLPIRGFLYNPFTVADVTPNGITIVLRTQHGPTTTALSRLITLSKPKLQISIEGPYGGSQYFPEFGKEFDRVLLVAGGVGATFILPFYHSIRRSFGRDGVRSDHRVKLIWIMRSAAEMVWAENLSAADEDEDIKMYVTKSKTVDNANPAPLPGNGAFGIENLHTVHKSILMSSSLQRPNLRRIVDETFRHRKEDRVAVIVCGPVGMARELRRHVGRWVQAGRYVWWHNESFGW